MLGKEEGVECEIHMDWRRMEQLSELKYLGYVLDESGTNVSECSRKVVSGREIAGVIRLLVNA